MVVKIASSDAEIEKCYPVMAELRPHIAEDGFLDLVREMEVDGYRLAYLEDAGVVSAVAGYRIYRNLFLGKHLYVDDLVTSNQQRSRGHGAQLLGYLRDLAIADRHLIPLHGAGDRPAILHMTIHVLYGYERCSLLFDEGFPVPREPTNRD